MSIRPDLFINRLKLKSSYKWKTISFYQLNSNVHVKLLLLFQQNKINDVLSFRPEYLNIFCVYSPEQLAHLPRALS